MECPHLEWCGKNTHFPFTTLQGSNADYKCSSCDSSHSIWICITCGVLNCGRYVNAHGLKHAEKNKKHIVNMETKELSVYCYECDDFITNDTPDRLLENIRTVLLTKNLANETDAPGRSLRPRRKRKISTNSGIENQPNKSKKQKIDKNVKKEKPAVGTMKRVGLRNLGNTCFMNSVLQSLSNLDEFCKILKTLPSFENNAKKPESKKATTRFTKDGVIMTDELKKVLVALSQGDQKTAISPESLFSVIWKVVPRFRGYQQQDAHEFLRYMLDRLHTELLSLLPGNIKDFEISRPTHVSKSQSLVTSVFGGTLQSEVTCLNCRTASKKHDPFLDLSIDIPAQFTGPVKKNKNGEKPPNCHVHDCLKKFVETEELADSERFFCNTCKSKQPSTKKFWIRRLPNVLCLHIKRFRWSTYARTKLDNFIDFPLNALDMSDYLLKKLSGTRYANAGSSLYDLAAVIVHHGTGAGSGHYTAFANNKEAWYHFNDTAVRETDFQTVSSSKAYILFYIQREFNLPKI